MIDRQQRVRVYKSSRGDKNEAHLEHARALEPIDVYWRRGSVDRAYADNAADGARQAGEGTAAVPVDNNTSTDRCRSCRPTAYLQELRGTRQAIGQCTTVERTCVVETRLQCASTTLRPPPHNGERVQ